MIRRRAVYNNSIWSHAQLSYMNGLHSFHPAVAAWFSRTFDAPTPAQQRAWPALMAGRDVLVAAPTGSGKTFAAFLAAIDSSSRKACRAGCRMRPASSTSRR